MMTGVFGGGYSFFNVVRYARAGEIRPLFGHTPMAFSTAATLVLYGVALFWIGWCFRHDTAPMRQSRGLTGAQMTELLLAAISAGAMVVTALIAALRRN